MRLRYITQLSAPFLAALLCLFLATTALACLGYAPREVLSIIWFKVLWRSDRSLRLQSWANILQYTTPLLFTGLAISVAFRAGIWNIGAQGQLLLGAIAANTIAVCLRLPSFLLILLLLCCASFAGGILAAVAGLLEQWRRVPIVLSTLLLNFVVIEFLRYVIVGPLHDPSLLVRTRGLPPAAWLPSALDGQVQVGFLLALAMSVCVDFTIRRTTFGFRLRAIGANPVAARFAGIPVAVTSLLSIALSGALAGLAGGVEVAAVRHELVFADADSAYGFTAIAVALLARLSPIGVIAAAGFFGMLNACFNALQAELRVPYVTGQAVQGLMVIVMVVLTDARAGRWIKRRIRHSRTMKLTREKGPVM